MTIVIITIIITVVTILATIVAVKATRFTLTIVRKLSTTNITIILATKRYG